MLRHMSGNGSQPRLEKAIIGGVSIRSFCAIVLGCVAVAGVTAVAVEGRSGSGVIGKVLYGPTCPVQRIGESCVRPYDAKLKIRRRPSGEIVARVSSGDDGRFKVRLRPGHYLIEPVSGDPFPRAEPVAVVVHARRFSHVTIMFDSGIR
jgi:hypothetical protein